MAFHRNSSPAPSSSALKNQLILSIGVRAFVHLPAHPEHGDFTLIGPEVAAAPVKDPGDGQEVEIIAWRPFGPQGLSYQIRRLSDRREWWARATCLRRSALAAPATV